RERAAIEIDPTARARDEAPGPGLATSQPSTRKPDRPTASDGRSPRVGEVLQVPAARARELVIRRCAPSRAAYPSRARCRTSEPQSLAPPGASRDRANDSERTGGRKTFA